MADIMKFKALAKSFLLTALIAVSSNIYAQEKPNVIVIYTDDQGSIDLNIYGAKDLQTPNMDALVKSGVRFTQFYGAPVCSPSRASLLTGKTPQRAGDHCPECA
jgi:arylsulfatase A-like enzyme